MSKLPSTACGVLLWALAPALAAPAAEPVRFNRDVRPILAEYCFACHGPDQNHREADLRLDTQDGALAHREGQRAIEPGRPEASAVVARITAADPDERMPPSDSGKQLNPHQVELLRRWIAEGAAWEGHWSFTPLVRPEPPPLPPGAHGPSVIDRFLLARLAGGPLAPAPEADRTTLARRLHFDLVGLPPRLADLEAFIHDSRSDAYERLVDAVLASPHFGERMAIWWLDLVRYADSVGYHGDQCVSVFPFREYVIDAFNRNLPFDQFTLEQLAGDLLPSPTLPQRIASGYNRLGMMSAEGGVQPKEYLAKYIAERVRNASGTWLGVTLGCAECHHHKYDPFTTQDFYRFQAFFADIKEQGLYSGAESSGAWGPRLQVPSLEQQARRAELESQLAAAREQLATSTPELAAAQLAWEQLQPRWTLLRPDTLASAGGAVLTVQPDQSVLASGPNPATDTYTLTIRDLPQQITALRVEVLPDPSLPQQGPGRAGNGNFVLTEIAVQYQEDPAAAPQPVPLQNASASHEQTSYAEGSPGGRWAAQNAIDQDAHGAKWGWAILDQAGRSHQAVFETRADLPGGPGPTLTVVLHQNLDNPGHNLGRFRLWATAAPRPVRAAAAAPAWLEEVLALPRDLRTDEQRAQLAAHYRGLAPLLEPVRQELRRLEAARAELDLQIPTTLVTEAVEPRMIRVLKRGNWMDDSGEVVAPGVPAFLPQPPPAVARLTRLDLARWIVAPDNPLTARVLVNRVWKLLFGAGLSRRLDDLGAQGEWPSHPELLDYLAADFRDSGWDLKRLVKQIVMSAAYRQSSATTAAVREADPYNRLLARQGRFRLDAELVRDNALAVSGLLVSRLGGRSVRPYQPPGYWAYLNFPQREWQNDSGEELYRRGLYTHWQRQYLHPSLLAFDAPSREECTADRPRSNTPLQSLVLLNDPIYVEAARALAELALRQPAPNDRDRGAWLWRQVLSRSPRPAELQVLANLLTRHRADYRQDAAATGQLLAVGSRPAPADLDPVELAAWTSAARLLLNLHETITRN